MRRTVYSMMLLVYAMSIMAQRPDTPASQQEKLNRGFVCIPTAESSSFLTWRLLGSDDTHTSFLLLKDGVVATDTIRHATSMRMSSTPTSTFQLVTFQKGVPTDTVAPVVFNQQGYHLLQLDVTLIRPTIVL